jgi:hypothetical protein
MHDPQHIDDASFVIDIVEDAGIPNAQSIVGVRDAAQSADPTPAFFPWFVLKVFLHGVGNRRCVALPEAVHVVDCASPQLNLVHCHSRIVSRLCYTVKKERRTVESA